MNLATSAEMYEALARLIPNLPRPEAVHSLTLRIQAGKSPRIIVWLLPESPNGANTMVRFALQQSQPEPKPKPKPKLQQQLSLF